MKKKKLFISILLIFILIAVISNVYAYFAMRINISVNGTSGNLICNAEIDSTSYKNEYGYAEFKVIVKNYNSDNEVSSVPYSYTLKVENNGETNALFGYENSFSENIVLNDEMNTATKNTKEYKVQVKTDKSTSERVDYKVTIDCVQSE